MSAENNQNELLDAIEIIVDGKLKRLKYNYYMLGVVSSVDNVKKEYKVNMNGNYFTLKARQGLIVNVNDVVYVCIANNDFSNKFIDNVLGQSSNQEDVLDKIAKINDELKGLISSTIIDKEKVENDLNLLKQDLSQTSSLANETKKFLDESLQDSIIDNIENDGLNRLKDKLEEEYLKISIIVGDIKNSPRISIEKRMALQGLLDTVIRLKNEINSKITLIQNGTHTENTKNEIDVALSQFLNTISVLGVELNEAILEISRYSVTELKQYVDEDFKSGILNETDLKSFRKLLGDYRAELSSLKVIITNSYSNEDNSNHTHLKSLGLDLDLLIGRLLNTETRLETENIISATDRDLLAEAFQRIINLNEVISKYVEEESRLIVVKANEVENIVTDLQDRFSREITTREQLVERVNDIDTEITTLKTGISDAKTSVQAVANSISTFEDEVRGSFKDGLLDASELNALNHQLDIIEANVEDFKKQYQLMINVEANGIKILKGLAKTNLDNEYTKFINRFNELKSSITDASVDVFMSPTEKTRIENAFIEYKSAIPTLVEALEKASDYILNDKITTVETEIRTLIEQTDTNIMLEVAKRTTLDEVKALINVEVGKINLAVEGVQNDIQRTKEELEEGIENFGLESLIQNGNFDNTDGWDGSWDLVGGKPRITSTDGSGMNTVGSLALDRPIGDLKKGKYVVALNGKTNGDFEPMVALYSDTTISDKLYKFNLEYKNGLYKGILEVNEDIVNCRVIICNDLVSDLTMTPKLNTDTYSDNIFFSYPVRLDDYVTLDKNSLIKANMNYIILQSTGEFIVDWVRLVEGTMISNNWSESASSVKAQLLIEQDKISGRVEEVSRDAKSYYDTESKKIKDDLDNYKTSTNQAITDLTDATSDLNTVMNGTFKDGIINKIELENIKSSINELKVAHNRILGIKNDIESNTDLEVQDILNYQTVHNYYLESFNDLMTFIETIDEGSDATTVSATFSQKYSLYISSRTSLEKLIRSIGDTIATRKDERLKNELMSDYDTKFSEREQTVNSIRDTVTSIETNVGNISERITTAETKIEPDSIISTVRNSEKYLADMSDLAVGSNLLRNGDFSNVSAYNFRYWHHHYENNGKPLIDMSSYVKPYTLYDNSIIQQIQKMSKGVYSYIMEGVAEEGCIPTVFIYDEDTNNYYLSDIEFEYKEGKGVYKSTIRIDEDLNSPYLYIASDVLDDIIVRDKVNPDRVSIYTIGDYLEEKYAGTINPLNYYLIVRKHGFFTVNWIKLIKGEHISNGFVDSLEDIKDRISSTELQLTPNSIVSLIRDESNNVINAITQKGADTELLSERLNLKGYVTISDLSGHGTTIIDGSNIKTGEIQGVTLRTSNDAFSSDYLSINKRTISFYGKDGDELDPTTGKYRSVGVAQIGILNEYLPNKDIDKDVGIKIMKKNEEDNVSTTFRLSKTGYNTIMENYVIVPSVSHAKNSYISLGYFQNGNDKFAPEITFGSRRFAFQIDKDDSPGAWDSRFEISHTLDELTISAKRIEGTTLINRIRVSGNLNPTSLSTNLISSKSVGGILNIGNKNENPSLFSPLEYGYTFDEVNFNANTVNIHGSLKVNNINVALANHTHDYATKTYVDTQIASRDAYATFG